MKIDTVMDMIVGGFQTKIQNAKDIQELARILSELKISKLVKDHTANCTLNIVFLKENTEVGNNRVMIGLRPRNFNLNENREIKKIFFTDFNSITPSSYHGTVKVHLH